jgi:small subunit ribosomal protein S9
MSDTTYNEVTDLDENEVPTSYSSATPAAATNRPAIKAPGAGTGRRLVPGTGRWVVNGKTLENYFPNKVHQQLVSEPFRTVGAENQYDVFARINGGGVSGQAGALRLGVARSLNEIDVEAHRPALKKAGFLSRDARVIERKKYGLKKARKRSQYSKR